MGQKTNPLGFRLGVTKYWDSVWFSKLKKENSNFIFEDYSIRKYLEKRLFSAGVSKIIVSRAGEKVTVTIHSAKPGSIIGKKGADIDLIKKEIAKFLPEANELTLNVVEEKEIEGNAALIAQNVSRQLEKRVSYKKAIKRCIQSAMKLKGVYGIKLKCSGRLGGAEIARDEWLKEGRVPLHTLRADIDYATGSAFTTYGIIGVKVWVFKGEAELIKKRNLV